MAGSIVSKLFSKEHIVVNDGTRSIPTGDFSRVDEIMFHAGPGLLLVPKAAADRKMRMRYIDPSLMFATMVSDRNYLATSFEMNRSKPVPMAIKLNYSGKGTDTVDKSRVLKQLLSYMTDNRIGQITSVAESDFPAKLKSGHTDAPDLDLGHMYAIISDKKSLSMFGTTRRLGFVSLPDPYDLAAQLGPVERMTFYDENGNLNPVFKLADGTHRCPQNGLAGLMRSMLAKSTVGFKYCGAPFSKLASLDGSYPQDILKVVFFDRVRDRDVVFLGSGNSVRERTFRRAFEASLPNFHKLGTFLAYGLGAKSYSWSAGVPQPSTQIVSEELPKTEFLDLSTFDVYHDLFVR